MQIRNSFDVPLPPDEAWAVLMDIPRIVPCMPGAELTEMVDERTFKGKVGVKLGPIALAFNGTAQFEEVDDVAHRAKAKARGADAKGRGAADATVTFDLAPSEGGSRVEVVTDVNLSGAVAQYGRGTGVIQGVATQLVNQFAACLKEMLAEERSASPAVPDPSPEDGAAGAAPAAADGRREPQAAAKPQKSAAKPISGLSLVGSVLWSMIRGLFGRGGAKS